MNKIVMEKDIIPKTDPIPFYNRVLVFLGIQMLFLRWNKERGTLLFRIIQSEEGAGVQKMPRKDGASQKIEGKL